MPYVVQMHGFPGSGKTTLAREIARALQGVVLELDITTDAPIRAGVDPGADGATTYEVHYAFAESLTTMGHSVVLDGAVFRASVETRSRSLASRGDWCMIETVCDDEDERRRRLAARTALPLQATNLGDWRLKSGTAEPRSPRLSIDTQAPLRDCVTQVMAYILAHEPADD